MTELLKSLKPDSPTELDSAYRLDRVDRRKIDRQILAAQLMLSQGLIDARVASYFTLDGASAAVKVGQCVTFAATGTKAITLATPAALSAVTTVIGVAVEAASPGGRILIALFGTVPRQLTNLGAAAGYVRVSATTYYPERVDSWTDGDYPLGVANTTGTLLLWGPSGAYTTVGGGGGGPPTGSAGGDLAQSFPNPWVVAAHFNAERLTFGDVTDGELLVRVGDAITSVEYSSGNQGDTSSVGGANTAASLNLLLSAVNSNTAALASLLGTPIRLLYDNTTSAGAPANQSFRLDDADPTSASVIRVDHQNVDGVDIQTLTDSFGNSAKLTLLSVDQTVQIVWTITGSTTETGYTDWDISYDSHTGALTPSQEYRLFVDVGGSDVAGHPTLQWTWTTSTSGNPGAGNIGYNNSLPLFANEMLVSSTTSTGLNVNEALDALELGKIRLSNNDGSKWHWATVRSFTDETGYFSIDVLGINDNGGSFSNGETIHVTLPSAPSLQNLNSFVGLRWLHSSSIGDTDPSAGRVIRNNSTFTSITSVTFDNENLNDVDVSSVMATVPSGVAYLINSSGDAVESYQVNTVTTAAGYVRWNVTPIAKVGSFFGGEEVVVLPPGSSASPAITYSTINMTADADALDLALNVTQHEEARRIIIGASGTPPVVNLDGVLPANSDNDDIVWLYNADDGYGIIRIRDGASTDSTARIATPGGHDYYMSPGETVGLRRLSFVDPAWTLIAERPQVVSGDYLPQLSPGSSYASLDLWTLARPNQPVVHVSLDVNGTGATPVVGGFDHTSFRDGQILVVQNIDATESIQLDHDYSASDGQFFFPNGVDFELLPGTAVMFVFRALNFYALLAPPAAGGGGGEANTGSNVGGGGAVFKQKSGVDFEHRTLVGTGGVQINQTTNTLEIDGSLFGPTGEANTGSNVGNGARIFRQKDGVNFEYRTLVGVNGITVNEQSEEVQLNGAGLVGGASLVTITPSTVPTIIEDWDPSEGATVFGNADVIRLNIGSSTVEMHSLRPATEALARRRHRFVVVGTNGSVKVKRLGAYTPGTGPGTGANIQVSDTAIYHDTHVEYHPGDEFELTWDEVTSKWQLSNGRALGRAGDSAKIGSEYNWNNSTMGGVGRTTYYPQSPNASPTAPASGVEFTDVVEKNQYLSTVSKDASLPSTRNHMERAASIEWVSGTEDGHAGYEFKRKYAYKTNATSFVVATISRASIFGRTGLWSSSGVVTTSFTVVVHQMVPDDSYYQTAKYDVHVAWNSTGAVIRKYVNHISGSSTITVSCNTVGLGGNAEIEIVHGTPSGAPQITRRVLIQGEASHSP